MAVLKKAALFLVVFSFVCSTSVFASEDKLQTNDNQAGIATQEKALSSNVSTQKRLACCSWWDTHALGVQKASHDTHDTLCIA